MLRIVLHDGGRVPASLLALSSLRGGVRWHIYVLGIALSTTRSSVHAAFVGVCIISVHSGRAAHDTLHQGLHRIEVGHCAPCRGKRSAQGVVSQPPVSQPNHQLVGRLELSSHCTTQLPTFTAHMHTIQPWHMIQPFSVAAFRTFIGLMRQHQAGLQAGQVGHGAPRRWKCASQVVEGYETASQSDASCD